MKSILLTTSAAFLVTGLAVVPTLAACPEDIDAFAREYDETLRSAQAGEALTASEQAQLFGLKTAAEKLHQAGKADMCAEIIERARLTLESAVAPQVIRPDEIVGRKVANAAGESLGEIEDVMLDPVSGRIAYVVVEHGGVLGIGDDLFAVPWRAMTFTPDTPGEESAVILDIPEERLEDAPRFDRKDESPLERREWVTSVHNYYGVEPYWQDEVRSALLEYGGAALAPQSTEANPDANPDGGAAAPAEPGGEQAAVPAGEGAPTGALLTPGAPPPDTGDAGGAVVEGEAAAVPSDDVGMLAGRLDKLEQRVTELSQTGMSKVEKSIDSLEDKVQQLSEGSVGDEMRQKLAGIEARLTALAGGAAAGAAAGAAGGQEQPAAAAPPDEAGQGQAGQSEAAQPATGQDQAGKQPGQPGAESRPEADQQAEEGKQTAEPDADQQSSGQQPQANQESAGQPGSMSAQQAGSQRGDKSAMEQDTAAVTPPAATDEEDAAAPPCEKQLAQLDKDLKQAEQRGIAISDVRSNYDEARAMLDGNSEALCRAAIKRARDELVELGFQPTEVN